MPTSIGIKLVLLLGLLVSCSSEAEPNTPPDTSVNEEKVSQDERRAPPLVSFKPPEVITLASRPKPTVIEVPVEKGRSYTSKIDGVETKIELIPPLVDPVTISYIMPSYTTNEGLALDSILSGLVDRQGNLWWGTNGGGTSRFDGKSFTTFSTEEGLPASNVNAILEDTDGNIWFGTDNGVSRYDGQIFTAFGTEQGLVDNHVKSLLIDSKSNLWIGTEEGLSRFDGMHFTSYKTDNGLAENTVKALLEDSAGNIWIGTEGGLSRFDGRKIENFTVEKGLVNNRVQVALKDSKGFLWFGTEGGVSRFDGRSFVNFTEKEGLVGNKVFSLLEDKRGHLWLGTDQGVSEFDGKNFISYTGRQGLVNTDIRAILQDQAGNLWFGTNGGGINRFDGKFLTLYSALNQTLDSSVIRVVLEDKEGHLWFGSTGEGLKRYDGKNFTIYKTAQGLSNDFIRGGLIDREGNLWLGTTGGGVSRFDGKSFTTYTTEQGLAHDDVRTIQEDEEGNLWFGTYGGGVSRFDGKSFTNYTYEQGLANDAIYTSLKDSKGNLWFGTTGRGVSLFDGKKFINFTTEEGLSGNNIYSFFEDKAGNIWVGTEGEGVNRFDGTGFINYKTEEGLPDNAIYQVISNAEGDILLGTNDGVVLIKGYGEGENFIPAQTNLKNSELKGRKLNLQLFNVKTGYPLRDANGGQNGMYLAKNGLVWMGTGYSKMKLVKLDFSALNVNKNPPEVFLQNVKINNQNIIWSILSNPHKIDETTEGVPTPLYVTEEEVILNRSLTESERSALRDKFKGITFDGLARFYPVPQELVLPYAFNNVTLQFAAIEPDKPQDVLYQYWLEGYDKDWSPAENKTVATFGNINEGSYLFKVKARSPYGIWSDPVTYRFTVLAPWYRTWWAYTLYAISSFIILYSIFRWRTAVLRKQFEHSEYLYHAAERFVPKRFLELLGRDHLEDVQLGDSVQIQVSALFADIRNFTTLAESLSPKQTALFLNTYTEHMAPIIRQNNGFISTFLGDGILALFPETPVDSINAALAMAKALPVFNESIKKLGFSPVGVGVGINTGDAMLCAIGEKERLDASVVSDSINTASRIEGMNKFYQTQLLISESVYQLLPHPENYLIRQVDKVILKGKTLGMKIYEVKSLPVGEELEAERLYYTLYQEGFTLYEKGDFLKAEALFNLCLEKCPEDAVVQLLKGRCHEFLASGTPVNWDGTVVLKEK